MVLVVVLMAFAMQACDFCSWSWRDSVGAGETRSHQDLDMVPALPLSEHTGASDAKTLDPATPHTDTMPAVQHAPPAPAGMPPGGMARVHAEEFITVDPRSIAYLVVTGKAYHDSRLAWAVATWMRWVQPTELYAVTDAHIGGSWNGHEIVVPEACCDRIQSQKKWREGIVALARSAPASIEWVAVVDDDSFIVVPNVGRFLSEMDPNARRVYGHRCPVGIMCGPATIYPRFLIDELAAYLSPGSCEWWPENIMSDVILGEYLSQTLMKVEFLDSAEFSGRDPAFFASGGGRNPQGWDRAPSGRVINWHQFVSEQQFRLTFEVLRAAFGDSPTSWIKAPAPEGRAYSDTSHKVHMPPEVVSACTNEAHP